MHKKQVLAGFMLILVLFAGCGTSNAGQNLTQIVQDWHPERVNHNTGKPSTIQACESPYFSEYLGFNITAYPDNATLSPEKYFAIDHWFAQIEFSAPGQRVLVLRAAFKEPHLLSITYDEGHHSTQESVEIDGITVSIRTSQKGCAMATWQRGDFQFLLHSNNLQGMIPMDELEMMVKQLLAGKA